LSFLLLSFACSGAEWLVNSVAPWQRTESEAPRVVNSVASSQRTESEALLQENTVFISYAREDAAKRLQKDLKDAGLNAWLDEETLLPGQNWQDQIEDAITKSRYFIPLFSKASVKKIGYVQSGLRFALDVLKRYPPNKVFYIPVRLDDCEIPYRELKPVQHADLFPIDDDNVWKVGINQILRAIGLVVSESEKPPLKLLTPFKGEKQFFVGRQKYIDQIIIMLCLSVYPFFTKVGGCCSLKITLTLHDFSC
jgi:hypothetical protein